MTENRNERVNFYTEVKKGSKWIEDGYNCGIEEIVNEDLLHDMISKTLHKCTYIKSIKDIPLYNGFRKITVTYDNGVRRIYIVKH